MPTRHWFYGYCLASRLALPTLAPAPERDADITLEPGVVPPALEAADWSNPFIEAAGDRVLLRLAGGRLRFLVEGTSRLLLDAPADADAAEVETFLCGAVAGVLLHRRRDLLLHASCMVREGRAVALAGPAGHGKSTLAAALAAAGWTAVTDDVCRIQFRDGAAWAVAGPARFRLWPDAVQSLGGDPDVLPRARPDHPKRLLPAAAQAEAPVRLAAVVRLTSDTRLMAPRLDRLAGPAAVMPMSDLLYRARLGYQLGNRAGLFQGLMRLAGTVPVWRLARGGSGSGPTELSPLVRRALDESP